MRLWLMPLLVGVVVVMQGCAGGGSPLDDGEWERVRLGEAWRAEIEWGAQEAGAPVEEVEVSEARRVEEYVALALARHPAIRAAEARVRRARERGPQVSSLDDPMVMVAPIGEMAETAAGQVDVMTSVSQRLPLPGKLDARGRIAELEAAQQEAALEEVRLRVAGDTRRAYWTYFFALRAIETTARSRALLQQFRDVADAQFRAGTRNQQDVLRAAAELGDLDAQLAVLGQRRETAAAMLRQLIDAAPGAALAAPEPAGGDAIALERDALLAEAARVNPALRRIAERMSEFEERQRLANLNRWPDLTVSFSYNLVDDEGLSAVANGRDQWWIGLGVNIPLWAEKYDAAEREAVFGRVEAASEMAAERNRVLFRVEDALLRLESQREVLRLLQGQIIPDARAAVEASAATYRTGAGDFLTLVDNWRKMLGFEVMEHQVRASVEQALADLQEAVGGDIDRTTGNLRGEHEKAPGASDSNEKESAHEAE